MGWPAFIVTTKAIDRTDTEILVAHWPHSPRAGAEWWMPIDITQDDRVPPNIMAFAAAQRPNDRPLPRLVVTLHGPEFTANMPRHWLGEMQEPLNRPLRRAQLRSFIAITYCDREDLKLPGATEETLNAEDDAAWFQCIKLARLAVEEMKWPGLLCQPSKNGQNLSIYRPEDT